MISNSRRLGWLLAISLGLNVFLLGFASARLIQRRSSDPAGEHPGPRASPRHLLGGPSPEFRAHRKELGAARGEVAEALAAEPFDRERLGRALAVLRERTSRGQELLHERLLERAATLPLAQRRALAQSRMLRGREPPP